MSLKLEKAAQTGRERVNIVIVDSCASFLDIVTTRNTYEQSERCSKSKNYKWHNVPQDRKAQAALRSSAGGHTGAADSNDQKRGENEAHSQSHLTEDECT